VNARSGAAHGPAAPSRHAKLAPNGSKIYLFLPLKYRPPPSFKRADRDQLKGEKRNILCFFLLTFPNCLRYQLQQRFDCHSIAWQTKVNGDKRQHEAQLLENHHGIIH
jgi:hypothetical protein